MKVQISGKMLEGVVVKKAINAHIHLRHGQTLKDIIVYTARLCSAGVAMGNLPEPVDDLKRVQAYERVILEASKDYPGFKPIMTIMLTTRTTPETIRLCAPFAKVLKFIPAATSTNAQPGIGIEDLEQYYPVLKEARRLGMIFSIHAERILDDNGTEIPEAERELAALPYVAKLIRDIPRLKIVMEHISTREGCKLVMSSPSNVAGTITAHHVCCNDLLLYYHQTGKIVPGFYCKPVIKSEEHREFVESVMLSDDEHFFFGSDSAAHPWEKKFGIYPPYAGIFSEPVAIPLIAARFHHYGKLDKIEDFLTNRAQRFYELPESDDKIIIWHDDKPWKVPEFVGAERIPVLTGGGEYYWRAEPYPLAAS